MKWIFFSLLFFLLLTSCGTAFATTTASSPRPTTLQVERVTHTINVFAPFSRTSTDAQSVQSLYDAALALPKVTTTGVHSCPADVGLVYHLRFLQNRSLVRQMDLQPSGCASLLVDKNDARPLSKTFIESFTQTVGISLTQMYVTPYSCKNCLQGV